MGRWRAASLLLNHVTTTASKSSVAAKPPFHLSRPSSPIFCFHFVNSIPFSAIPSRVSIDTNDYDSEPPYYAHSQTQEDEETKKVPVKAYFLCTRLAIIALTSLNLHAGFDCSDIYLCGSIFICVFRLI